MFYFECGLEAVTRWCSVKKEFLKILQNSPENTWEAWEACNFIKKETLAQVFSCEFCEISKNTFFTEHLWATASVSLSLMKQCMREKNKESYISKIL